MNLLTIRFNDGLSILLLVMLSLITPLNSTAATNLEAAEYEIKAAFLYNIASFVSWPESAFTQSNSPFRFCIIGDNPFDGHLKQGLLQQTVKDRMAEVIELNYPQLDALATCQIAFISQSEKLHLQHIVQSANRYPLLLISDIDNFIDQGGMVKFFTQKSRIRLAINPLAVEAVSLVMNANLLRVAQIVQ